MLKMGGARTILAGAEAASGGLCHNFRSDARLPFPRAVDASVSRLPNVPTLSVSFWVALPEVVRRCLESCSMTRFNPELTTFVPIISLTLAAAVLVLTVEGQSRPRAGSLDEVALQEKV